MRPATSRRPRLPRRLLLALAFVSAPSLTQAGTHWLCELTPEGTRLSCRTQATPASTGPVEPAAVTAQVNGTRFPLDAQQRWTVDLFAQPDDLERLELLARATICYRSPGCSVALAVPGHLARR